MNSLRSAKRRFFLKTLGASALATGPSFGVTGANEEIRVGLIGCGVRGNALGPQFHGLKGVRVVGISDPDTQRMENHLTKNREREGYEPTQHQDYRKILERDDIDVIVVTSPNHWHALHMVQACEAGKDVYIEKPISHKIAEVPFMLEAERKYDRIVQAGTQNRSDTGLIEAHDFIHSGEIGKITSIRGLCYRNRNSIGRCKNPPLKPPSSVDYNLWLGPAPDLPIKRANFHYDWNWVWNTGNGDVANQGVHEIDVMSWFAGDPGTPAKLNSFGQRFAWDDAGQTPNMHTSWYELGGIPAVFEVNDLWVKPGTNAAPAYKDIRVGVIVTCEGGEFRGGRSGGYIVAPDGKTRLNKFPGDAGGSHAQNFIDAVRSRKSDGLRGKLKRSGDTAAIAHLANLSYRTGKATTVADLREKTLASSPELLEVLDRQETQLKRWSIDFDKTPYHLGSEARFNPETGKVTGPLADTDFLKPTSRGEFKLPGMG
ncbi:MAG: Gfo/Idh/MocA family oxidoreductase [Verrucomicrobiota bacterium]